MQNLESFLQDSKHTLQIIENVNDEVKDGKLSLEGVAVVRLDVENMYNNMSEDLATEACKEFLESDLFQQDGENCSAESRFLRHPGIRDGRKIFEKSRNIRGKVMQLAINQ